MISLPKIETILQDLTADIQKVRGVSAIVLGGSRARGTHTAGSDIDLGIYYDPLQPLDLQALSEVARRFDDQHRTDILTQPGSWGHLINGGGWIKINSIPVDFLYRDLDKVRAVITECLQGKVEMAYQPGHPNGFVSSMYLSKVAICKVLWKGPELVHSTLKSQVIPYPTTLLQALIEKFAWEIEFTLLFTPKAISRMDVPYASGCCYRIAAYMQQTLFALNKQYCLKEKGAVAILENLTLVPKNFQIRIEAAFRPIENQNEGLNRALKILTELALETGALVKNFTEAQSLAQFPLIYKN
ncbi:MAG: nucleotidyltransferase domain-containing protein [Chloroflexota bacterium]